MARESGWIRVDAEDETPPGVAMFTSVSHNGANTFTSTVGSALHGSIGYDAYFDGTHSSAYGDKSLGASYANVYARVYFMFHAGFSLPTATGMALIQISSGESTVCAIMKAQRQAGGSGLPDIIYLYTAQGGTYQSNNGSFAFAADTLYYVEIHYKQDASVGGVEGWLNGSLPDYSFSKLNLDTSAQPCNTVLVGNWIGTPNAACDMYIDDLRVEQTGPIGAYMASGGGGWLKGGYWWQSPASSHHRLWTKSHDLWTPDKERARRRRLCQI
jgi:hypothetical protein